MGRGVTTCQLFYSAGRQLASCRLLSSATSLTPCDSRVHHLGEGRVPQRHRLVNGRPALRVLEVRGHLAIQQRPHSISVPLQHGHMQRLQSGG